MSCAASQKGMPSRHRSLELPPMDWNSCFNFFEGVWFSTKPSCGSTPVRSMVALVEFTFLGPLRSLQTRPDCSELGSSCRRYGGFIGPWPRCLPKLAQNAASRVLWTLAEWHETSTRHVKLQPYQHANTRNQTQQRPRTFSQKLITLFTPHQTHHARHAVKKHTSSCTSCC